MAIENILSAIEKSDKNNDKVLDKTEISDFLTKIEEDNSDSAKIAREKIKSLKSKVGENIDKLKNNILLDVFLKKFDTLLLKKEGNASWNYAKRSGNESHISFGPYQFTGSYIKAFVKEMNAPEDIQNIKNFKTKDLNIQNKLTSYLSRVGSTPEGIKAQKKVFFEKTIKSGMNLAKNNGVTNISSIAQIIDANHNGGVDNLLKSGVDLNNPDKVKKSRIKYLKNKGFDDNITRVTSNAEMFKEFDKYKLNLSNIDFKQLAIIGTAYEKISQGETNVNQTYIDNAYKALKIERPTNVGGIGHLSILDVLGFGYGALNVFGAVMEGISGNWGDAIQKLTIAYIGYKNIEREVGGNLSDFSKKISSITERYSEKGEIKDGGKNLRRILEKIYNGGDDLKVPEKGEDENVLRVELISNLFPNDKADNMKYEEQIGKTFKDVNYEKLLNFNGEINAKNVKQVLNHQNIFDGLGADLQNKVLNLLNISKREKISCFDEFNGVYEYIEWNLSPNFFDKITHGLDVTE